VLAGAETIRGGDLVLSVWRPELVELRATRGLPRHPIQVVATLHGAPLEEGLLFNVPELPVIMITVARGAEAMRDALAERPWITVIVMESPHELPRARRAGDRRGVDSGSVSDDRREVGRRAGHALLFEAACHA